MANELSGIERQLVLEYLMDGNVPVTVTAVEKVAPHNTPRIASSQIFPVALRSEQMTVLNQGIILLKNVPASVHSFDGKQVRVQFYFNKLGLYFVTTMKRTSTGLALVIPAVIQRVQDAVPQTQSGFSAMLYYETGAHTGVVNVTCTVDSSYPLLVEPKWSDIEESEQKIAKTYLEKAVASSRSSGKAIGNGLFLIPVCRYLAHDEIVTDIKAVETRSTPPTVLYINHERIVFGYKKDSYSFQIGSEYALKLGFPLQTPVKKRTIYITCRTEAIYKNDASESEERFCAICRYTSIKEEDIRFLYEMNVGNH